MMIEAPSSIVGTPDSASTRPTSWRLARCAERPGIPSEAAEVDDAPDPRGLRRAAEARGGLAVAAPEPTVYVHGVHQIERRLDVRQGRGQRGRVGDVTAHDSGGCSDPWGQHVGSPCQAPDALYALLQRVQEPAADIPRCAGQE